MPNSLQTVSVLITDLVGSTSLESRVGPVMADELRREHFAVLRKAIESNGGEEVKNLGDGLMAVFPSAAAAVACGVSMQQGIEQRNRRGEEQLSVRVGISLGDVTREDDDYFGMPVIEAARLGNVSAGDQILTTEVVRLMAGRRGDVSFRSLGDMDLKGIPQPVPTCEVAWEPLDPAARALPVPGRLRDVPPVGYVGREAERERLRAMRDEARSGQRRLVLVSGDPGIGKTRLATHVGLAAHAEGDTLLYGRCEEDLPLSYGPWVEALRHYVSAGPESVLGDYVPRHGGELTRLAPEIAERFADVPAPQESDPETERYLLFGAVAALLEAASSETPAVLILDDLHWADKPTLSLLRHVMTSPAEMRLLIVGTYRESDLARGDPLTELLAELRRERGVERIALDGLAPDDVVGIMEAAAGHEMDRLGLELAGDVARETDGNPFYVTELLRHLIESGALVRETGGRWVLAGNLGELGLPQSVREVVAHRVERLGEDTGRVLGVAAVIGRDFDVELLEAVVELGEDELLDRLDEAVQASVLTESADTPGRFSFAHALINHTLYEDMGTTRRARLHRRIAEAIEDTCGEDPGPRLAELAHHWSAARTPVDAGKALAYSRRAGERALDDLAPDEAMRWFRQALDLHDEQAEADPAERCDLLIGLGDAQRQAAEFDFRNTLLDAARMARELGDADRLVRAALANSRGVTSAFGLVDDERVAVLEAALEGLDPADTVRRARLLALLSVELTFGGDFDRRLALSDEASELARSSGDARTLAHVLIARCISILAPSTLEERRRNTAELVDLTTELGDPVLRFWATYLVSEAAGERGDFDELDRALAEMHSQAEEVGQPTMRYFHTYVSSARTRMRGRLEEAEALADAVGETGEPDALMFSGTLAVMVQLDQGRFEELLEILPVLAEDLPGIPAYKSGIALAHWELGDSDEAGRCVQEAARRDFDNLPHDQAWSTAMTNWAEVAAHIGPPGAVEVLYEKLAPWAHQVAWNGLTTNGSVARYVGLLAGALGRHDEAQEHFAAAAEVHERADAPIFLARTRVDWAHSLLAADAADGAGRAREMLEQALATAREHGCVTLESRAAAALEEAPV